MKWAKYFGLLLLSFCLFFGLSPLKQVKASDVKPLSQFNTIIKFKSTYNTYFVTWSDSDYTMSESFGSYTLYNYNSNYNTFSSLENMETWINNNWNVDTWTTSGYFSRTVVDYIEVLQGNVTGTLPDYIITPTPPDPSWWDQVKNAFMDFVGSESLSAVLSGNWLAYIEEVLFGDLWTIKVGEGEDDMIVPETVSATPTPSLTPIPTPIQYSTVIDPGTGEVHYHYTIDVSGTPVPTSSIYPPVTSSPPGPGSGSTIDEPVAVEDYYEPDDSLSVPKLRIFKFLLRMTGNDIDVGMDSLDDNMAVMDATLEDNAEAISGVGDLFQLIPVKWFLLIGTLACFPVIAAMIKSLLGG